jgi:hypothetical protein
MDASKTKQRPQDNTALNEFANTLLKSSDANNKIKINEYKSPSFYLPPLSNVLEFLDYPSSQKQLMDLLEKSYEVPLEISRTSRYDFFSKGVGQRTVNKIITWCKKLPLPFETLVTKRLGAKIIRSIQVGSNAGNWYSALYNFDAGYKTTDAPSEYELQPLFEFIKYRCKTEVSLLSKIRSKVIAGELESSDINARWGAQIELWSNSAGVTQVVIDDFAETLKVKSKKKNFTEQQTLTFVECYCQLNLDFYLEAITHYEVGCRMYYGKNKEKLEKELGMITKAINAYATDDNIETCFDGMLTELKAVASELTSEISFRKLATFIEIEEDESIVSGESLADKQYNQLKDWRNGVNLPSWNKLITFLQNLDEHVDTNSGWVTFLMCRIALGVDKLVQEILANCKGENCQQADVELIIKKVLATMPEYYKANLKKQLEKREPTHE